MTMQNIAAPSWLHYPCSLADCSVVIQPVLEISSRRLSCGRAKNQTEVDSRSQRPLALLHSVTGGEFCFG